MKTNRTFWRILMLSLALVVFLAFSSCQVEGETTATGTTADATTADPTTEPGTTEPATTEPATTEPATSELATSEPATSEPATSEPAPSEPATSESITTEPATTEDPIAGLAKLDDDDFVRELPAEFENGIVIEAGSMEDGCTDKYPHSSSQYHLSTIPASDAASANGVTKLLPSENAVAKESGIFHYYFSPSAAGCKAQNNGEALSLDQLYMRWTFEVAEAGTYKLASYHRVKKDTGTRNGYIQFDNGEKILLQSTITEAGFNAVNDGLAGAYLLWGNFEIELSAGKHTITHTVDENTPNYIHWRAIYLAKVS